MEQWLQAFILGNTAILTNVCILPLYPGLVAFMAGNAANERAQRATKWLGLLVLLGVLSLMLVVGALLYALQRSFGDILPFVLPVIYAVVILLGVLMLTGRNPFARLGTVQTPVLRNPYVAAYVYGLLLGPMTLPCTGPIVVSAFLLGAGSTTALLDGLVYFFFFGLGFGWPLVLLPLLAAPLQRRFTRWTTQNYKLLTRVSGVLLVVIGLFGIYYDLLPNL
ncbi:MAG: sulfite exporter TauE/SafE family protein [Ardenticatenaceae bacterium]|nr:sulfite exporter TauE/SafE family protein [Anaerolineales bacterium]MCB8917593.1 sulfite exporter TauE/SafE family protein [Ardenticatenaceae bacterium]